MAKEMIIERSLQINKAKSEVFNYLKLTKNQDEFSTWNMKDPNKKTIYKGTDGIVGFIYSWESKDKSVGAGSQEIISINQNRISYEVRFEKPMKNIAQSEFLLKEISDNKTEVSWIFRGPTKFPFSLFKFFFEKMLGKDISKSLENLRYKLEK